MATRTKKTQRKRGRPRPAKDRAVMPKQISAEGSKVELLDMNEAVALLKTTRPTFYRWLRTGKIRGMKVGRQWRFERPEIERFLKGEEPRIELRVDIGPLIQTLEGRAREVKAAEVSLAGNTELERAVALMLRTAVAMRASDIHLAATAGPGGAQGCRQRTSALVRYRLDGVLHPVAEFDVRLLSPVLEQWKILASCNPAETRKLQTGRLGLDYGDQSYDIRVQFVPSVLGETFTARILAPACQLPGLEHYAPKDAERIRRWLKAPSGLILVAGPTGCGKTTILYSFIRDIAHPEIKVMTVENPVELVFPGVVQIQVDPSAGLTFVAGLRAVLRSDPDVIVVGEIRDPEALKLTQQAALTGHLVLGTFHAEEAAAALLRLMDMGGDPFLVCDATRLVLAQRLVRLVCRHCSTEETLPPALIAKTERLARSGGLSWEDLRKDFRKGIGCSKCRGTGFRGRTAIAEALEVSPTIGGALRRGASVDEIRTIAVGEGMTTMAAHGIHRAAQGETALMEVMRVLGVS